jgi:hypothetical protein
MVLVPRAVPKDLLHRAPKILLISIRSYTTMRQNDDISAVIARAFHPKRRLQTLFVIHQYISYIFGGVAFLFPWMFGVFFTDGAVHNGVHNAELSGGGAAVAHLMIRIFGAMWLGQGYIAQFAAKIDDGKVKLAFIKAYFFTFSAIFLALVWEHLHDEGTMRGGFFGILKLMVFCGLSGGYGWFAFFQPPSVYDLGSTL